ncbi:hypothetical protein LCGC14_1793680 [marine sediment metagenome]|uniref:Uncharacterized protein n=1 Tax=marine sediment metagenome TaxID=412755 RepID=A0A0F9GRT4_9ZZZZ
MYAKVPSRTQRDYVVGVKGVSKIFHHGGKFGDMIFALYTMKALGGGQLVVSDYHGVNWNLAVARTMTSFLLAQPYIESVRTVPYIAAEVSQVDYDLQHAEDDKNPEAFPEWHGGSWPGNCNIRKRYAVHFGVEYDPEAVWLTAPQTKDVDVAVHIPSHRIVRTAVEWCEILDGLSGLKVMVLGAEGCLGTNSLLESADHINSAKVFLGVVSSCNALAEGLGKRRLVEQADGCDNVNVGGKMGLSINSLSNQEVIEMVETCCAV